MSTVTLDNKTILVTGVAGFIGSNLVKRIYQEAPSATVIGIDNMNAYHTLHSMQLFSSTDGYQNPSLFSTIEIQCFGQLCSQLLHPTHFSFILDMFSILFL